MTVNDQGLSTRDEMRFALQIGEGGWIEVDGVIDYENGTCQRVELPGFVTYADEGGVTASFHVASDDGLARWTMRDGYLETVEPIEQNIEVAQLQRRERGR
jgi:hypothetical protein